MGHLRRQLRQQLSLHLKQLWRDVETTGPISSDALPVRGWTRGAVRRAALNTVMISTKLLHQLTSTGFGVGNPGAVSMSADGTRLAVSSGPMRISTNSGASWYTSSLDGGYRAWSADGTRLTTIGTDQKVYTSTNAGVTWTQTASPQSETDGQNGAVAELVSDPRCH